MTESQPPTDLPAAPDQSDQRRGSRVANFFGLKRNLVILLIAIFVIGTGEELWMRFVPKYLKDLGAGFLVIGLYDGIRTLLGAIYAYPGGVVVDRWGHRRAFLVFNILSIIGYAVVLLIPHWAAVIAGMFLFLSWTCFSLPATLSLVAATLNSDRHAMGVGIQMIVRRLPIIAAPYFGGMLIDRFGVIPGVRIALIVSIVLSAATLYVQRSFRDESKQEAGTIPDRWSFFQSVKSFNAPLRSLLLSDILVRFGERITYAWVIIFAMDYIGATGKQVGILTAVEMIAAAICIIPSSYFADKSRREPFVVATFIMFTLFPMWLLISRTFPMLLVAFLIRGLKEFGDTSRKALILGYSDPDRRGQMVGAYYLVRDLIVSTGAIVGAYLWYVGPRLNLLAAALCGVIGTIIYVRHDRQARADAPPVILFYGRKSPPK
jgi:MFS family permease